MLRGDLQSTPLADLLERLSGAKATGCVYLLPQGQPNDAKEATISLREGEIYGVILPGSPEALGVRLVATNRLTLADLAEARLAQETELASWLLADLLIHLGLADEDHVLSVTGEQALSDLTQICTWTSGSWRFRRRTRLGRNLPEPLPVDEALATVRLRQEQWDRLLPTILGAAAVVSLAANRTVADSDSADGSFELGPEAFVLLCTVDGTRTITELAAASGFTVLDAGLLIAQFIAAGLVEVTLNGASELSHEPLAESDPLEWEPPSWPQSDRITDALARVSAALSEAMTVPSSDVTEPVGDVEFLEPAVDRVESAVIEPEADAVSVAVAPLEEPATRADRMANAAQASRMLSQLAGDDSARRGAEPEPVAVDEPAGQHPVPVGHAPAPRRQTGPADTAALLRELSSLGAENGGGSGGDRPSAPRPAPATTSGQSAQLRKRKGLFGRS